MSMLEILMRQIPPYYHGMHRDGFAPEQILMAARQKVLDNLPDDDDPQVQIVSEVEIK